MIGRRSAWVATLAAAAGGMRWPILAPAAASSRAELLVAEDMKRRSEEVRKDVAYPPTVIGDWECSRKVSRIEGSRIEAETTWRALGGRGELQKPESYAVRFVPNPDTRRNAAVEDRGYNYAQRSGVPMASIDWSPEQPDLLTAAVPSGGSTALLVVGRTVTPYESKPPFGFGFSEVVRITERRDASSPPTLRTAQLERNLAPASDGSIEGTEVVSSFATGSDSEAEPSGRPISRAVSSLRWTRRRPGGESSRRTATARMMAADDSVGEDDGGGKDEGEGVGEGDGDGAPPYPYDAEGLAKAAFRFEQRDPGGPRPTAGSTGGVDDIANGLTEAADIGGRGLGVLGLGLEIGLGGLFSPVGLAFFAIFGALVFAGEFGNTGERFLTKAEVTNESGYYVARSPDLLLQEDQE
jgi:hypothetical protein